MNARPTSEAELAEVVRAAAAAGHPLEIRGGGTRGVGHPVRGALLDTGGLSGITLYEPRALTLVARAGTALAEIESSSGRLTGGAVAAIEAAEIPPEARDELVDLARYVAARTS